MDYGAFTLFTLISLVGKRNLIVSITLIRLSFSNYAIRLLMAFNSYNVNGSISIQSVSSILPEISHASVPFITVHAFLNFSISLKGSKIAALRSSVVS